MPSPSDPSSKAPRHLVEFLDDIDVPVVLMDGDGVIRSANRHALAIFRKESAEVSGRPGGDLLECVYARLPAGCGQDVHCAGCAIRRSVMHTHLTGQSVVQEPATMQLQGPTDREEIRFLISTEKFCDHVMLIIETQPETP